MKIYKKDDNERYNKCYHFFNYNVFKYTRDVYCWVSGGAVRDYWSIRKLSSDIDLFFRNMDDLEKVMVYLEEQKFKNTFENDRIINMRNNEKLIQLIKLNFENPDETIRKFDFTVCCCAIDSTGTLYVDDNFFIDLARKSLIINELPYPLSTLQRLQKYIKKGYIMCNGNMLKLSKAIAGIDFNNIDQNHIEYYSNGDSKFVNFD